MTNKDDPIIRANDANDWIYSHQGTSTRPAPGTSFFASPDSPPPRPLLAPAEDDINSAMPAISSDEIIQRCETHICLLRTAINAVENGQVPLLSRDWLVGKTRKWTDAHKDFLWLHFHRSDMYAVDHEHVDHHWLFTCIVAYDTNPANHLLLGKVSRTVLQSFKKKIANLIVKSSKGWAKDRIIEARREEGRYEKTIAFYARWREIQPVSEDGSNGGGGGENRGVDGQGHGDGDGVIVVDDDDDDEDEFDRQFPARPGDSLRSPASSRGDGANEGAVGKTKEITERRDPSPPSHLASPPPSTSKKRQIDTDIDRTPPNEPWFKRPRNIETWLKPPSRTRSSLASRAEETSHSTLPQDNAEQQNNRAPTKLSIITNETNRPPIQTRTAPFTTPGSPGTLINSPIQPQPQPQMQSKPTPSERLLIQRWDDKGRLMFIQQHYNLKPLDAASLESFFSWYEKESRSVDKIERLEVMFPWESATERWRISRDEDEKFGVLKSLVRAAVANAADDERRIFLVVVTIVENG